MSANDVTQYLRGQIIKKPEKKKWFIVPDPDVITCAKIKEEETEDTFAYTYEPASEWTPYNSNLHMQGIKVYVKDPLPTSAKRVDLVENTLFLMEILRDKKKKENEEKKALLIRSMAMAKKMQTEKSLNQN